MTEGPQHETKTVRAPRGAESRSIAKWQKDGWELLDQRRGTLLTELVFRRPTPKPPWALIAIGAGVLVVLAIVIGIGVATENDDAPEASSTGSAAASPEEPSEEPPAGTTEPEATPSPTPAASQPEMLTIENSPELAALLTGPTDGDSVAAFATANRGRVIEFDGAIGAMDLHDGYGTRYDILISYGDSSERQSSGGPNFQLRDVNITDLGLSGDITPDSIGVGDNIRIRAEVLEYEPDTSLFLLDPVETQIR